MKELIKYNLKIADGTALKILAMMLMLCDHIWVSGILDYDWLTIIGRLSFPIYAFEIAEGYSNTKNFRSYLKRMMLFALISEIPFNLMVSGQLIFPSHQNVLFTFLLSLLILQGIDLLWKKFPHIVWKTLILAGSVIISYILGFVTFVDYFGFGILTVILFWITRNKSWGWLVQLVGVWYINWNLIGGYPFVFPFMDCEILVPQQAFAMLALIPIWMYNGKRGPGGKQFQFFSYIFYPLHMLILWFLAQIIAK